MWRTVLDLSFGYAMYKIIKFLALNLYLPAIKEGLKQIKTKIRYNS